MGKPVDEPIQILNQNTGPRPGDSFLWRGQSHGLQQVSSQWAQRGRWWEGESYRRFFRILTITGMTLDLCREEPSSTWTVAEVED